MKEYKFNHGDEVLIKHGPLNGIRSTIIHRENGDNYLEPLYKVSISKMLIPESYLKLYKSTTELKTELNSIWTKYLRETSSEVTMHSLELLAKEIYKSENKEVITAFEQFCKEIGIKITKEIYLNDKSIIKKEIK